MKRFRLHRDFIQRIAAFVGVVLVVFSFQANYELNDSKIYYYSYYGTLFISSFVLLYRKITQSILLIIFFSLCVVTVFLGPSKSLGLSFILPFGYYAIKYQRSQVEMALVGIFFLNFMVVFAQFIGLSESVYNFTHYSNQAVYRSFFDAGIGSTGFLPQFRPSGIFPSPTYVSSFCVLFFSLVAARRNYPNRLVLLLFGVHIAMLGSTVGLCLGLISIPLLKINRRLGCLILGYVTMTVLYAVYLPDKFNYNFNYGTFWKSFYGRLNLANPYGESVLQHNIGLFSVMCLAVFFGMLKMPKIKNFLPLIPFGIAIMLPALVHDIALSIFYWYLVGAVFGTIALEGLWQKTVKNKGYRLSFGKSSMYPAGRER